MIYNFGPCLPNLQILTVESNNSFVRNTLKRENPLVFHEMFMLNQNHSYKTRAATYHFLDIPQKETTHFGQYSVKFQASSPRHGTSFKKPRILTC